MKTKALIVDLLSDGDCVVSRKKNTECYCVRMEGGEEAVMTPLELLKMLRFRKAQESKSNGAAKTAENN